MITIVCEPLPGTYLLDLPQFVDDRGEFVKTVHAPSLQVLGLSIELREEFFSVSRRNVLRGMHFQVPPADHQKIVYCISGRVLDVLVDLRLNSPGFGKTWSIELTDARRQAIWIPPGVAHGFLSLSDLSYMVYKTDHEHDACCDQGIRWDSFGFDWPIDSNDILLSERDQKHLPLDAFQSPFCA